METNLFGLPVEDLLWPLVVAAVLGLASTFAWTVRTLLKTSLILQSTADELAEIKTTVKEVVIQTTENTTQIAIITNTVEGHEKRLDKWEEI